MPVTGLLQMPCWHVSTTSITLHALEDNSLLCEPAHDAEHERFTLISPGWEKHVTSLHREVVDCVLYHLSLKKAKYKKTPVYKSEIFLRENLLLFQVSMHISAGIRQPAKEVLWYCRVSGPTYSKGSGYSQITIQQITYHIPPEVNSRQPKAQRNILSHFYHFAYDTHQILAVCRTFVT